MDHQNNALVWMENRENQIPKGGILADDVAMVKTLIALVWKMRQHEKENDEKKLENHQRRPDNYQGRTLVVCPLSLIDHWEKEIEKHSNGNELVVCVHHGSDRAGDPKSLLKYDIVITTYGIVRKEFNTVGPLFQIKWQRIILDEAHIIRNYKSQQSQACVELNGSCRWALSKTTIHNSVMDRFALIKFLKFSLYNNLETFKTWIDNNIKSFHYLITPFMLRRRTKQKPIENGQLFKGLPIKDISIIPIKLSEDEMKIYLQIKNIINKSTHHLVYILRLRQFCCHPGLIYDYVSRTRMFEYHINNGEQLNNKHDINANDNVDSVNETKISKASSINKLIRSHPMFDLSRPSSKFKAVLNVIKEQILPLNEKSIIVSQWTSVLNILEKYLQLANIPFVKLCGDVNLSKRNDLVADFNKSNSKIKLMLLSLTTNVTGLNLIGGNNLLVIEPHWNPQLEEQVLDRIYRIDQTKPVKIYKFICQETYEEQVLGLQKKKLRIANKLMNCKISDKV